MAPSCSPDGEPWPTVRLWDGTLMPLFSQATTGRDGWHAHGEPALRRQESPAIPSTPWANYLTEQHAQDSQQVGCLRTWWPVARLALLGGVE